MEIRVRELDRIWNAFVRKLIDDGIETVELPHDFYWDVLPTERYRVDKPKEMGVGQLYDDWNDLQRVGDGEIDALIPLLEKLGSVVRSIGELVDYAGNPRAELFGDSDVPKDE